MRLKNNSGFTLIEILLFVIIAATLIGVATSSIGARSQQVQFTDGMRSLEAYMQRQFSNVQNGTIDGRIDCNGSSGSPSFGIGSDGNCVFLGVMFGFADPESATTDRDVITTQQIVGVRLETEDILACTDYTLYCVQPAIVPGISERFEIPWGIEIYRSGAVNLSGSGHRETRNLGFVRDPNSTKILPIVIVDDRDPDDVGHYDKDANTVLGGGGSRRSGIDDEVNAYYCFRDIRRDLHGSITVSSGLTATSVELGFRGADNFNPECEP